MRTILFSALIAFASFKSIAQSGSLDLSFGYIGKKVTTIGIGNKEQGKSVAIQADGKIVVAGYVYDGSSADIAVIRYNTNGNLDNSFDNDGIVTTDIGSKSDYGTSIAIQPNGKIVVAGYSYNGLNWDFAVMRYNSNGTLDNSFNYNGIVTTNIGSDDDFANSVAIQSNGKIVVAGNSYNGSNTELSVVRYNTNGSLDNSFDNDGIVTTAIVSKDDFANSVAIQTDGKIVVTENSYNGLNTDISVVRYNTNGSLDNSFDNDGIVTTDIGSKDDLANSVAIQTDGKIVVAGNSLIGSNWDFAVLRYNTNGTLDNSFDNDGIVTTTMGSYYDRGNSVAIQADGKIVVAGTSNLDFALARYNTNGTLDTSFDNDGKVTTFIGSIDECYSIAIQTDGKIVATGYTSSGVFNGGGYQDDDILVIRYNNCINSSSSINVSACSSYTWRGNTYNISGTYKDTIPNAGGCDSVMILNLTINNSAAIFSTTSCGSYTWLGNTYNISGTYKDTIPNAAGCDSLMTLNLTIKNNSAAIFSTTSCGSYTWLGNTYNISGTYKDTIPNAAGCDSVITLNLTINNLPLVGLTLISDTVCINAPAYSITGGSPGGGIYSGTGVSAGNFNPNAAGPGLHTITYTYTNGNNCSNSDSALIFVDICTDITGISNLQKISIFPNPFSTQTTLQSQELLTNATLSINNYLGQTVVQIKNISGRTITLNRDNLDSGLYFIQLLQDNKVIAAEKLVIADK